MGKSRTELTVVQRKKTVPRSAFTKGNPHRFQPGDERINKSGKSKSDVRLVTRSLRDQLGMRAPAAVCQALGLPMTSSWGQCVSRRLLHLSLKADEAIALAAIRSIVELSEGSGTALLDELAEDVAGRPVLNVHFISSNGNGQPDEESRRLLEALDSQTIDAQMLGPET